MKTTLYVMSATGNSLYVAQKLAQSLGESEIVLLPDGRPVTLTERVGIIGPVYDGFPSPPIVDFLKGPFLQADKSPVKYLFCLHTCGKAPAFAPQILEKLVTDAGCAPSYQNSVRMIDTHVGMVPMRGKRDWKPMLDEADRKLSRIAKEIDEGAIRVPSRRMLAGFAFRFLMPRAHKRQASTGKYLSSSDVCISCGACAQICPMFAITMEKKPRFGAGCIGCFACLLSCPKQAVLYQMRNWQASYVNPRSHIETYRSAKWKTNSTK
ncbi:MAG: EFR1 family ferrodoxin [Sphaerochaetaceae bacterium]|nr:EFR1 family ferrodoxin [Spirochaetales bacterium]MDY5499337.1 EFR1 family ferrodoxin [Sphaerochaetaceae bacterium]